MVVTVGTTMIVADVAPVFHEYALPPDAVSVVLLPDVMVTLPDTEIFGEIPTNTVAVAVSVHEPDDTITEYVVLTAGATVTPAVVAPVLQE